MRRIFGLFCFLLLPAVLQAQASPDSVKHRNDCRLAEQAMSTGHPAPHVEWALNYIATCGFDVYGAAIASAVRRQKAEADTAILATFWRPSRFLRDRQLFDASMEIAADKSASAEARVFAFLSLVRMMSNGRTAEYRNLVGGFDEIGAVRGGCASITVSDDYHAEGTPLPQDFREQAQALGQHIREDASEPLNVRTAASCI